MRIIHFLLFFLILYASSISAQAICTPNQQQPCGYNNIGECRLGYQLCENGQWSQCFGSIGPSEEVCHDDKDNNCNGQTDEGCECITGQERVCGPSLIRGICQQGVERCVNNQWEACEGALYPEIADICTNNLDDDCDGQTDEGCTPNATTTPSIGPSVYCFNSVQDFDETGIDCGGSCRTCPSCSDRIKNQNEIGVDCGGPCSPCATCNDAIQNQNEKGIDCGGPCISCSAPNPEDEDNDQLNATQEARLGTSTRNPDTDGDGIRDKQDPYPLCPNNVCNSAYGETLDNCPEDCTEEKSFPLILIIILLIIIFIFALYLYHKFKSSTQPLSSHTRNKKVITNEPSFDPNTYTKLTSKPGSKKKATIDVQLEKAFNKADKFLKK